jgi:uncharacterized membrane protein YdbT with pleckstrin-like domain
MDKSATWAKLLSDGEKIEYEFSVGKIYRKRGLIGSLIFLVPLALFFHGPISIGILLMTVFMYAYYLEANNSYAFTDRRIIIHTGVFSTETISVDYSKITDVSVKQGWNEKRIYKTGELRINTAGTSATEVVLKNIEDPYEVRKILTRLSDAAKHKG